MSEEKMKGAAAGAIAKEGRKLLDLLMGERKPTVHMDVKSILGPQTSDGQMFIASVVTNPRHDGAALEIGASFRVFGPIEEVLNIGGDLGFKIYTEEEAKVAEATLLQVRDSFNDFVGSALRAIENYPKAVEDNKKAQVEIDAAREKEMARKVKSLCKEAVE